MQMLTLVEPADLGALYEAARRSYSDQEWLRLTGGTLTPDLFASVCLAKAYPTLGFQYSGKPIGGLLFDGSAAHIAVLPEYHGRWALLWEPALKWVFSLSDPFVVTVDRINTKCLRFMDRNGWPRIKEDETHITYEVSSRTLRFRRRKRA